MAAFPAIKYGGVSARHTVPPVAAIWLAAFLAFLSTLYSPAFGALAAGCAMFLYVSYAMPILAGIFAEGKTWTEFGPFKLGALSKPIAVVAVLCTFVVIFIGIQPPNDILISYGPRPDHPDARSMVRRSPPAASPAHRSVPRL